MRQSVEIAKSNTNSEILWAGTRSLKYFQAENLDAILLQFHDLLKKLNINKDLNKYSLETVSSFYKDAVKAGFKI